MKTHVGGRGKLSTDKEGMDGGVERVDAWGSEGQARCSSVQGASLFRKSGCWLPGGPARPCPAPLTIVMHGCPHEAAVGLDQGLVG